MDAKERKQTICFMVNGDRYEFTIGVNRGELPPSETLMETLRERLDLTGTKNACDRGSCGCCTVIMDGDAVPSCTILTVECEGRNITTVEGLRDPLTGDLDELQQSFVDNAAFQCGYCTPGIIMTSKAMLEKNPSPSEDEIKDGLSGNFCRCNCHYQVIKAVKQVAGKRR